MSHIKETYGTTRDLLLGHGGMEINSINHVMQCTNSVTNDTNDEVITDPINESYYYTHDQFNLFQTSNVSKFRVLSINCQSLHSKYNELKSILDNCTRQGAPIHAVILQETHLQNDSTACLAIDGYSLISQPAVINRSGGLAIYIHEHFTFEKVILDNTSDIFESHFVKINVNKIHSLIIGNIYRRPDDNYSNYTLFTNQISNILDKLNKMKCDVMLAGDFNINLLKINVRPPFAEFLECILSAGYLPQITLPTRYTKNNTFSLIDNFFTKLTANTATQISGILVSSLSDHFGYFTALDYDLQSTKKKNIKFRKETQSNISNCVNDLINAKLADKINCGDFDDPNSNYDIIHSEIQKALNNNIPEQEVKFNKYKHFKEKWMSRGILNSIKTRDKLFLELKSMNSEHMLFQYQKDTLETYNKMLKKVIRTAKRKYYNDFFTFNSNNMKTTWNEINNLIGKKKKDNFPEFFNYNNRKLINDFDIAQGFNKYFAKIGISIAESMTSHDKDSYKKYLVNPTHHHFQFNPVTEKQVLDTLNLLNNKTSCGHDGISTNLLKKIFSPLLKPLTIVINQSIRTGIFPDLLKIAKLVPLFKKDDPHIFGNYRPIALLPSISKLFEKIIHTQIVEYVEKHSLIYPGQYGFRNGHSCELSALELVDRAAELLANKKDPFCIFLDLSKAFDILSHSVLLEKLKYYGFDSQALNLILSYLNNRKQYVVYNDVKSDLISTNIGVPQGSILGPLLFLLYVNDMNISSKMFTFINFADDTTLFSNLQAFRENLTPQETEKYINKEINLVEEWLLSNKLSLNAKKTKALFFKSINRNLTIPKLEIGNNTIETVQKFNFLGIILDEKLKWNDHINHIAIKISRANGILNRLKHCVPQKTLLQIYHAIISPYLNYGNLLWGFNCARIIKMQKKSIRIINNMKFNSHTEPLFKKSKVLKLDHIIYLKILTFNHKLCNNKVPTYFNLFRVENQSQIHNYATRGNNRPAPLRSLSNYQNNTLRFQLNKTLITAPLNFTVASISLSIHSYKYKIKKDILEKYSNLCSLNNCYICGNNH